MNKFIIIMIIVAGLNNSFLCGMQVFGKRSLDVEYRDNKKVRQGEYVFETPAEIAIAIEEESPEIQMEEAPLLQSVDFDDLIDSQQRTRLEDCTYCYLDHEWGTMCHCRAHTTACIEKFLMNRNCHHQSYPS